MFQPVEHWLQVVRGEFLATPGLRRRVSAYT